VRSDFLGIAPRSLPGPLLRHGVTAGLRFDCLDNRWIVQHVIEQCPSMRQIRTQGGGAPLPEMHAQEPQDLAVGNFPIAVLLNDGAERQRLAEPEQGIAPVNDRCDELARAPGYLPVLQEQELEPGIFLVRRPAPVDGDGHEQKLAGGPGGARVHQAFQSRRASLSPPQDEPAQAPEHDKRRLAQHAVVQRLSRRRQPVSPACIIEHERIGEPPGFEHVTDGGSRPGQ
jgi:hypothetical protein